MPESNTIMGTIVAIIVIVAGGIPITQGVIDANNFTGMTAIVIGLVPVFLALAVLGISARLM